MKYKVEDYIKNNNYVAINTLFGSCYGYIISQSNLGICVMTAFDFHLDGYLFLPNKTIRSISYSNEECFFEKIFIQQGIINSYNKVNISLNTWEELGNFVMGKLVIIGKELNNHTYYTKIVGYNEFGLLHNEFDTLGKSSKKNKFISYEEIFSIMFDNRYLNIYKKYCE